MSIFCKKWVKRWFLLQFWLIPCINTHEKCILEGYFACFTRKSPKTANFYKNKYFLHILRIYCYFLGFYCFLVGIYLSWAYFKLVFHVFYTKSHLFYQNKHNFAFYAKLGINSEI